MCTRAFRLSNSNELKLIPTPLHGNPAAGELTCGVLQNKAGSARPSAHAIL